MGFDIKLVQQGGGETAWPLGKIVCVGRNYAAHARELDNPVPDAPLLFIKPVTSALAIDDVLPLRFDLGNLHYETELALLITQRISRVSAQEGVAAIGGVGLALDLTLRDVQAVLKEKGHPWEVAKGFDGSCPFTHFIEVDGGSTDFSAYTFTLSVDGQLRQHGNTADLLFPVADLVATISHSFTLEPGDVVLTGTPKGVGQLHPGERLQLALNDTTLCETVISESR